MCVGAGGGRELSYAHAVFLGRAVHQLHHWTGCRVLSFVDLCMGSHI